MESLGIVCDCTETSASHLTNIVVKHTTNDLDKGIESNSVRGDFISVL